MDFQKLTNYQSPVGPTRITTLEMHTGGEPLRIVASGLPEIRGDTILARREYFKKNYDHLRTRLMWEPRGHADMYGAIITAPVDPSADFGVIFMHNEGYSTMCGHAILALTKMAVESGMTVKEEGNPLIIETPAGLVRSFPEVKDGVVVSSSFENVPSYVVARDRVINLAGIGEIVYSVAFGGAYYGIVEAKQLGLQLESSCLAEIIKRGQQIKQKIQGEQVIRHPFKEELGFLYGTIFTGEANSPGNHSRNACVFADGELDRSATGTGISARAALHFEKGEFAIGEKYMIESITGSTMEVEVKEEARFGGLKAIIPVVSGRSFFTGKSEFWFDPADPQGDGFILR